MYTARYGGITAWPGNSWVEFLRGLAVGYVLDNGEGFTAQRNSPREYSLMTACVVAHAGLGDWSTLESVSIPQVCP